MWRTPTGRRGAIGERPREKDVPWHPPCQERIACGGCWANRNSWTATLMPVAPVAREARGFEAEHRPDQAFTDLPHETPKARALHRATGGAPEVVVDDPDLLEAVRPGHVHERGLPALTLA